MQGISYGQDAPDTIVEFKDINLAGIVRHALGLPTEGVDLLKISKAELEKLTELTVWMEGVNNLTGLEHASQLTVLNLTDNDISDVTPLAQLTQLEHLDLRYNDIIDVTPLAQLTQLERLDLYANDISDVTPLAQLTQLEHLDLRYNDIIDVTPLLGLTSLKELSFEGNPIEDVSSIVAYQDANPDVDLDMAKYFIREEDGSILTATTDQPLAGATLDDASVTLTLSSGAFVDSKSRIEANLTLSGIQDIYFAKGNATSSAQYGDTQIRIKLRFQGSAITTDSVLTVTVGPKALGYYNGPALTVQIPVTGVTEAELTELSQAMAASTPYPLTEATLNGSVVTLKLTDGAVLKHNPFLDNHTRVSGISGVTIVPGHGVWKINDTEIGVELRFTGNISEDTVLIFTVESVPIARYNGPPRTAEIPVSATSEAPTGELVASTPFPLTKATLDDNFVRLTLQNDSYGFANPNDFYFWNVGISGTGIRGVQTTSITTYRDVIRLSRSEILVKIDFQGDFNSDVTLTFTIPPRRIANYNGPPLTAELPVAVATELRVLIPEFQQHSLYWINGDTYKIESVGPFDAVTQEVITLTVDTTGGKLYWGERSKSGGIIKRANLDGTNIETLASLSSVPQGLTIDAVGNQIYWTNNSDLQIQTANLNGEGIKTVVQLEDEIGKETEIRCDGGLFFLLSCWSVTIDVPLTTPSDITVNTVDGRLYWAEVSGRIRRVNLDGTNVETFISDLGTPYSIAVVDDKVYWTEEIDENSGKIQHANLNGTNIETLATVYGGIPFGLSIDTAADKIYWTNSLGGIQRMDIDGGEVEAVVSGITAPGDFVLLPSAEPVTPTAASTDAMVSVSPASAASPAVGDQLAVSLNITDGEAVAGYQATVQFDDTALRYVSGANGDYLPAGAFFVDPKVEGNLIKLNAVSFAGESNGDGTLTTLTFEVIAAKASTLTLSDVLLTDSAGETFVPQIEGAEITESPQLTGDVNGDGTVNIADLVLVASNIGKTGQNAADVNGDGQINIADLVLVAGALGTSAAAPSLHPQALEILTTTDIKEWLSEAQQLGLTDAMSQRGILFLQQLLTALIPKETTLLANYPNPFNPETWIPYHLAKDADVTLRIYAVNGTLVRTLTLGYQPAGMYQNRSRAAYWDGKNAFGESVASGVYFYTFTAGDFSATRKLLIRK